MAEESATIHHLLRQTRDSRPVMRPSSHRGSRRFTDGEVQRLTVRLPVELIEAIDKLAAKPDTVRSDVVRAAIGEYLQQHSASVPSRVA